MKKLSKSSVLFLVFLLALALPMAAFAANGQGGKKQNKQNAKQNQTIEANEEALDELEGAEVDAEEIEAIDEEIDEEEMPEWVAEKKALKQEIKAEKAVLKAEVKEAKRQIRIMRHGQIVSSDVSPVIKDGRVLVPLRALAAITGATVTWDQESQTISIIKDGITMQVVIGENSVKVGDGVVFTDMPAQLEDNRTIVPLRFIAETLNLNATWNPIEETVVIEDVAEPVVEEPVIEEPAVEEPVIEEPAVEEPVIEEPAVEEPVI